MILIRQTTLKKRASVQPSRRRSAGTSDCKSTLSKRILLESVHVLSSQAAPRIPFLLSFLSFCSFFFLSFFLPSSPPCFLSFILLYVLFSIVFPSYLFFFSFLFFSLLLFCIVLFYVGIIVSRLPFITKDTHHKKFKENKNH